MKIETIAASQTDEVKQGETQVMRLKVTGPVDRNDAVLQKAHELVKRTGSRSMAESFEWALSTGIFVSER